MTKFKFARDVAKAEWEPLPRDFKAGEEVCEYQGHDYGCARDDWTYGRRSTIACSLTGGTPFFTVPVEFLRNEYGHEPPARYGPIP